MRTVALVVAAGRGERAARAVKGPKQYARLAGRPVLTWALDRFVRHPRVDAVQVVIHPDDEAHYAGSLAGIDTGKLYPPVGGGADRQASVLAGFEALAGNDFDAVLIHDAARPHFEAADIDRLLDALASSPGAILAVPVADTLKRAQDDVTAEGSVRISETVPRAGLWRALTPQAFRFADIYDAHRLAARAEAQTFTDDASVAECAGLAVALVPGGTDNIKITTAEDFAVSERLLRGAIPDVRTGHGFDVHRFADGDTVWLCGVAVPHTHRLTGHSDADVGLHALTDAILGALGEGDIGLHFPPTDPQWKDARSSTFLAHAVDLAARAGAVLTHLDVTLICEAPKIGPHREEMRARIAEIAGIGADRVAVKATTTEGLGFTGREEGIAAMATATVVFADRPG